MEDEGLGAEVAVEAEVVVFEAAEGFAGVVGAVGVGGVEDVAQFVAGEAIEAGVVRVEFRAEQCPAVGVEGEGRAFVAEVRCPAPQGMGGVGELQHTRDNEVEVSLAVGVRREDWKLFVDEIVQVSSPDLMPGYKIQS